ncbi:MAG TPA: HNH endonuclease [Candidatus Saccharimonadia bacterium]|nr:HNH endonuclease [Candidatus Saccharimonadia bacterium]
MAEFIHVHHCRPLSEIAGEYVVDPIEDLRPVCPNCHAVIHRRTPPFTIEEVRSMLAVQDSRRTLMRPPVVKGQRDPLSGFFAFFPPGGCQHQ